ncbi:MAG: GNAT family N-acetyltransferase [Defluviitaleaceae bacterium]|nr:GNAT family N-acetyltransferase [Defluviitaleaceae bacterium]
MGNSLISKIRQNENVLRYLRKDLYPNLAILGHLEANANADIYIFDGDIENGIIVGNKDRYFYYLSTHNPNFLREFWEMLPFGEVGFSSVASTVYEAFKNACPQAEKPIWSSPCESYVLIGEFTPVQSSEYVTEPLTLEDAEEVDEYHQYRSEHSIYRVRDSISYRDSACVRINGQLAAWCLVHHEDGSLGPIYTKEEFRRRGLAELVSSALKEKLISKNILPFMNIVETNKASLELIKRFPGFKHTHDCIWFGLDKK